jgi:DNA replication and repair protein RecF
MLQSIFIINFRNISFLKLNNLQFINYIKGPNGSGKTNILNAIYILFSSPKSFNENISIDSYEISSNIQVQNDINNISINVVNKKDIEDFWMISYFIKNDDYQIQFKDNKVIRTLNKKKTPKIYFFPVIFYKPEYKFLISAQGLIRKALIDDFAKIFFLEFKDLYKKFIHYQKKRNELLEKLNFNNIILTPIEKNLAHLLYEIMSFRYQTIAKINIIQKDTIFSVKIKFIEKIPFDINKKEEIIQKYIDIYKNSRNNINIISDTKFDCDILLFKNDNYIPIKQCSMGEKQSAIISLFISQAEYFKESILLLDEPFTHLDLNRTQKLKEWLNKLISNNHRQIFITEVND